MGNPRLYEEIITGIFFAGTNMRKIHLSVALIIVSGSFLFSGCQSVESKAVAPPEVLAEFEIQDGVHHIILPVTFQGEEYQFVLDTGSTNTIFDDSFKDKLGKRFLWPKKASLAHGKKAKVEYFHAQDAYLGPLNLKVSPLIGVLDLDLVPGVEENRNFQGVIGIDFLRQYIVQIDFDNGKVTFFRGKKDTDIFSFLRPKEENKHSEWGEPINLKTKLFSGLRYYIKGRLLDNTSADFLIDSGWCSPGTLQSRLFKKVNSNLAVGTILGTIYRSQSTTPVKTNIGYKVIERFSIGSFEYKNNIFQKSNDSRLGLPFLSRHLVTFDFPNHKMYLKKGENFNKPASIGIYLYQFNLKIRKSGDNIIAFEIDPNGLAYRKGIRQKDILLKINDQDVSSFSFVEFLEFLSQLSMPKDGALTFTFKRGDDIIEVSFEKSDIVTEKDETD